MGFLILMGNYFPLHNIRSVRQLLRGTTDRKTQRYVEVSVLGASATTFMWGGGRKRQMRLGLVLLL